MERTKNRLEINDNLQSGKCSKETAGRIFARYAKADLAVVAAILIGTQTFANRVERLYSAVQIPVNVYMDSNVQYRKVLCVAESKHSGNSAGIAGITNEKQYVRDRRNTASIG